jgi:hypothetical protein
MINGKEMNSNIAATSAKDSASFVTWFARAGKKASTANGAAIAKPVKSMRIAKFISHISIFMLLCVVGSAQAESCRTVMLPESDTTGGAVSIPPGGGLMIEYYPPTGARVGIEFWFHAFPAGAPQNTQYLLVYLNRYPDKLARRIFHAQNTGSEYGTGLSVNFPMSTWIHQDEHFIVGWLNNTDQWQDGYLIVTLRECYP